MREVWQGTRESHPWRSILSGKVGVEKITQRKGCFVLSLETHTHTHTQNQSKLNNSLITGSQYHSPERLRKNSQKSIDPCILFFPSNLLLLKSFLNIWPRTWKQTFEREEIMPLNDCGHQRCSVWLVQTLGSPLADASSRGLRATLSEAKLVLLSHHRSADPTE